MQSATNLIKNKMKNKKVKNLKQYENQNSDC